MVKPHILLGNLLLEIDIAGGVKAIFTCLVTAIFYILVYIRTAGILKRDVKSSHEKQT
jgi:hypothetical protein